MNNVKESLERSKETLGLLIQEFDQTTNPSRVAALGAIISCLKIALSNLESTVTVRMVDKP